MEFAAFFSTLGTKVTVVEMLPKILGPLDDEISEMLQKTYEKRGVEFCLRCKVTGIEGDTVVYEDPEGKVCRVSGDKILVSVGRRANLQGFGLENIGVELALNPAGRPYGIKVDESLIVKTENSIEGGYIGVKRLIATSAPEAIYATSDEIAYGAMDALKDSGFRIPQDIAVVGFGNDRMSNLIEPKLTTVELPLRKMGIYGARILFDKISGEATEERQIVLRSRMRIRKSCGHKERIGEMF